MTEAKTSLSMLQGMRDSDPRQWERFVDVYSALVYEWCRRAGMNQTDSADVVQEVFRTVAIKINEFRRDRPGDSFHGWLWGITRYKTLEHFRRIGKQATPVGGSTANLQIHQVPDSIPDVWDDESQAVDQSMVRSRALELLQTEFESHTWQAFWKTAVEDVPAADVATQLQMTVGAVYNARYKVLKRLRSEFEGMFDIAGD